MAQRMCKTKSYIVTVWKAYAPCHSAFTQLYINVQSKKEFLAYILKL